MKLLHTLFAVLCLLTLTAIPSVAQDDTVGSDNKPCISISEITARCIEPGPDGYWRYAISFSPTYVHRDADAIYVSSSTGHVGTQLFHLPSTSNSFVFRYAPVTSREKACFTFTVYDTTDEGRRRLCRIEKCIELPKCEVKCEDVHKKLRSALTVYEGEDALLKGLISLVPSGVDWLSISIQNARHITVCSDSHNPVWQNLQTDITRAVLSGAADPQIGNHQARWNFDSCFRLVDREFKLLIDLPPFCPEQPSTIRCTDTAEICIKIAFKLCDGPRCDTTVCFRMIRRCKNSLGDAGSFGGISPTSSRINEHPTFLHEYVSVHPNPTDNNATIEILTQSDRSTVNIDIIDINGVVVLTTSADLLNGMSSVLVPTESLVNGFYTVRLQGIQSPLSATLIVNH